MYFDKSPVEPAHPMVVELHDSLVAIYKLIREKYQAKIDTAFNDASRQIGFVITTTLPVDVEIADGKIKSTTVAAPNLKGTLFEKVAGAVGTDKISGDAANGTYRLYLPWFPALKLRLRTDFMEPAHLSGGAIFSSIQTELSTRFIGKVPFHGEPVHWFDPGTVIAGEEAVLINAIDEVYPELRLAERVSTARQIGRALGPGVREPAHFFGPGVREPAHFFGPGVREPAHFWGPGVREPAHFFGPGVREPAHFQQPDVAQQFASELASLLKKFGF